MAPSPRQFAPYALLATCVVGIFALRPGPAPLSPLADETVEALPVPQPALPQIHAFPVTLSLCPTLAVANAPPADAGLHILGYTASATLNGVTLARAPVETACLSSGFGARNGQVHTGLDLYNPDPVSIYAAADGTVREAAFRDDFGNMLVIAHENGVFTRYAHLASMPNLAAGDSVLSGETIGVMGNTAASLIPRHLHYEILTGEWGEQAGSFALTPVDVLGLPGADRTEPGD
ncbi:M23 family metallopeptidase [Hyphomonas johnsonii]|uniref:Peptidase M23 n=1 Tax=Hyphomonas johnsonii MHS-2 TaxID=1280950 RepID=A0A059FTP3_9PROT|nr:M23 family metallopeptidase [Hyphomonas johnsonii]KCZ94035.1 peptidase M23 [Hyphomonas johnsonii MHS-2]